MLIVEAAISALLNVGAFAGLPFLIYAVFQSRRSGRTVGEAARLAGLQLGDVRYLGPAAAVAAGVVALLVAWPPPIGPFIREGSPQRPFAGLGLGPEAIAMTLLYGAVKTGFSEEFLFRGMIAGSLARRLSLAWANLLQAAIFTAPHLLALVVMPEMAPLLPAVFAGALVAGWLRVRSGSILGPWLIHAAANVTVCLSIAARTDPSG